MSQRLINKVHPKTGALFEPLYVSATGRQFWPIMGASPDDPSNGGDGSSGSGDGGEGNGNGGGSEGQNSNSGQGSGEGSGEGGEGGAGNSDITKTPEYQALMNRMQAADRRASAAEQKIKEQEDAKKDDLTKAQEKATELETTVAEKDKVISGLNMQIAFLTANEHQWHDPEAAMALAQANGYLADVVKDDGTVDKAALKVALKKLATEKKFLVKSGDGSGGSGPSGGDVGKGTPGSMKPEEEEALRRRFPALNL